MLNPYTARRMCTRRWRWSSATPMPPCSRHNMSARMSSSSKVTRICRWSSTRPSPNTGLTNDGGITAMQFRSFLDGGGYGSYGVASTYYTGALQATTYAIPRYRFEAVRVFTNKPPCGPKRGHGTPQPRFALETHFDKVAEELGLDPVELRLRNLPRPDSLTVNWLRITSCGLEACINKVVEGSGFLERRRSMPRGRGLGFAVSSYLSGAGTAIYWNDMPHSEVQLKLDRNGGVALLCGA